MYIIYKHTNRENGKLYVGLSSKTIEERPNGHLSEEERKEVYKKNIGESNPNYGKTHTKEAREKMSLAAKMKIECPHCGKCVIEGWLKDGILIIVKRKRKLMKIKSITRRKEKQKVYDIETHSHNYILGNGVVTHNSMDMYAPIAIPGGKGLYFASSSIVLGSSKAKSKNSSGEVSGAIITASTKKSRFCKENSKLKYLIKYDGGIHPVWGLDDDLYEFGFLTKPSMGWYSRDFSKLGLEGEDKKWRAKEMAENWREFYGPIINNEDVKRMFEEKYTFAHTEITDIDLDEEFETEENLEV